MAWSRALELSAERRTVACRSRRRPEFALDGRRGGCAHPRGRESVQLAAEVRYVWAPGIQPPRLPDSADKAERLEQEIDRPCRPVKRGLEADHGNVSRKERKGRFRDSGGFRRHKRDDYGLVGSPLQPQVPPMPEISVVGHLGSCERRFVKFRLEIGRDWGTPAPMEHLHHLAIREDGSVDGFAPGS